MTFMPKNTCISGFSSYLPEKIITSDEMELKLQPLYSRLKLPEGRLELMTGIKERRYWDKGSRPSELAAKAATNLFSSSKLEIKKQEVEVLIYAGVCRDFLEPSTASVVHSLLELPKQCQIFDLSNACLGVLSAMSVASSMIEAGQIKNALIVTGENGGPLIWETIKFLNENTDLTRKDIKKYIANLTIGSAAFAISLSHKEVAAGHEIIAIRNQTDSSANTLCQGDGNTTSLMMETDSEELLKAGVSLAQENWNGFLKDTNWNRNDIDWAIGHQVGTAHEQAVMQALETKSIPTFSTYEYLGNTGSAALPCTLMELDKSKEIKKDSKLALLGIGSGLSSIMMGIKW